MPLRVRCPKGHTLTLNESLAGKRVKCPTCQTPFTVPGAKASPKPAPAAAKTRPAPKRRPRDDDEDDEDDRPRRRRRDEDDEDDDEDERPRRRRVADEDDDDDEPALTPEERRKERVRDKKQRLRYVSIGLLLHSIKLWIYALIVLAVMLNVLFLIIVGAHATSTEKDLSRDSIELFVFLQSIFLLGVLIGVVVAPILGVVGSGFCLVVPKKSEARGTILASFVCDILPLFGAVLLMLAAFGFFDLEREKNERLINYIAIGNLTLTLIAMFLFIVFLRQLCAYLQKPVLGSEALNLVAYLIVEVVTLPLTLIGDWLVCAWLMGMLGSVVSIGALFLVMIGWFAQFYYLFLLQMVRLLQSVRDVIAYGPKGKKEEEEEEEEDEEDEEEDEDD
jgi:hypothetical protein